MDIAVLAGRFSGEECDSVSRRSRFNAAVENAAA
jgi:hypothetical protein